MESMTAPIFFTSPAHKARFLGIMQHLGKVHGGKLDPEYGAALYILTASAATWQKANGYIASDRDGIDFAGMLAEVDFSGGYSVLVKLASNLFNQETHTDPIELMRLDDSNFQVALTSLLLRRESFSMDDFQ